MSFCLLVIVMGLLVQLVCGATNVDINQIAEEIRTEATRPNNSEIGRPLPLTSHWSPGVWPFRQGYQGYSPDFQIRLIEEGHRILPWMDFPGNDSPRYAFEEDYHCPAIKRLKELKLPFVLTTTQWEQDLYRKNEYLNLPEEDNPNVVNLDGDILPRLSPFGPVEPWREVGRSWGMRDLLPAVQQWYPDPPRVFFLLNNEANKLWWHEVESLSKRYVDTYGLGHDDDFKRKLVGDGWIERYRAMQEAMKEALVSPEWQNNATFVGYGAFGPSHLGRWGGWWNYTLTTRIDDELRISPHPLMWDGGSPSYYTAPYAGETDFRVQSVQIQSMNWIPMLEETLKLNPNFWFEISIWDGHSKPNPSDSSESKRKYYESLGQTYTPERYKGMVQYGMWLLRPRAVREYRGHMERLEDNKEYFMQIVEAVDSVYENPILTRFWRKGELVPNRAAEHPYQVNIPEEYKNVDRWFLLETDLDPARPWNLNTEIPVFSLALVIGEEPEREWLIYAHAPLGMRENVRVTVPEYDAIEIDATVEGSFYVVNEKTSNIQKVELVN